MASVPEHFWHGDPPHEPIESEMLPLGTAFLSRHTQRGLLFIRQLRSMFTPFAESKRVIL